ncbi:coiled-coil domain-containing protein 38 [Orycteropus afer afer]|uniref:Coiled-coil domain-containing protein 38 n=1 Tax=Orycteropus afer afer TaxID=1230840 RepID=A0A8B7AJB6_ORYAF|nr:coiled-coil domain-containing protein 38 [Orycteropus afer afer]
MPDHLKDDSVTKDKPYKIFFKDLFLFKENEMEMQRKEKFQNRTMKVHQKSTFSSRMKSRSHLGQIAFYADTAGSLPENFGLDPTLLLRLKEGADANKTVHEFINDQRDRFLLEYALSTKRKTIKKYEDSIVLKERQLTKAEKKLQEDAMAFEEFLRENDQKSVDALKIAAQETLNKLQATADLKKASMEVQAVKSEIAKTEFLLMEYMKYGLFLLKLSPRHWQVQQALKRMNVSKSKDNLSNILPKLLAKTLAKRKEGKVEESRRGSFSEDSSPGKSVQGKTRDLGLYSLNRPESISSEDSLESLLDDDMDYDLVTSLYFLISGLNLLREEKMKEKQKHQEERLKAALERAVAQPKKKLGRRLIFRSRPRSGDKHELQLVSETTKTQEEEYFFT